MLIEIQDTDSGKDQFFAAGGVLASNGDEVARWYYYSLQDAIEIWFEPDKDFVDLLSPKEIEFLEMMIRKEIDIFEKEQEEFEQSGTGVAI